MAALVGGIAMGLEIRKRLRLWNYDYSLPGAYFITICTWHRRMPFGSIVKGRMELSEYGAIARQVWSDLPRHFARLEPDAFVVMPNHVHIVLVLKPVVAAGRAKRVPYDKVSAPLIINQYKSYVTKAINQLRNTPKATVWQRSYRDHVVRDENELHYIREYIQYNPLSWDLDRDNPAAVGADEFDNWLQKLKDLPVIQRGAG
jgi:REP element-mobilizing transposase RayT